MYIYIYRPGPCPWSYLCVYSPGLCPWSYVYSYRIIYIYIDQDFVLGVTYVCIYIYIYI